jgi:glutamine phosphoribosylpyrophosphate amidotransferase
MLTTAESRYAELKASAEQAQADQAAADAVKDAIAAIGEVTYTEESKAKIEAARAAWNALTETQQALVDNLETLTAAEDTYAELEAAAEQAADQAAASAVMAKINAIGEVEYTDACEASIEEARDAYNSLTDEQKALVENLETLTNAEAAYAELKAAAGQDEPTDPTEPSEPTEPSGDNLCKWDNVDHGTSFGGRLIKFFHSILYFFAHLFGRR